MKSLLLLLALAAPAFADDDKAHVDAAMKAHADGNFELALTELQAAYDIAPKPELLYAMGQVQAKLGRCKEAIVLYEKFAATQTDADSKAITRQAIDACKVEEPQQPPPPTKPPPPPPPKPSTKQPFYTDVLGDALVGAGVVAGVASVLVYVAARGDLDDAEVAPTLTQYRDDVDAAKTKRAIAVALAIGGGALIAGGIVRFATIDPLPEGGAVVAIGGRF